MSQERTERDWTRDREIIAAIIETVHSPRNHDEDTANILCFAAHSVGRWPAALDEIDRLNAVIESQAAVNAQWIDRLKDASAIVTQRDKQISDLTAKVQERDAENERMRREQGLTIAQQFKEIERLRAALKQARDAFVHIGKTPFPQLWLTTTAFEIGSIDRALKGAE